ncbi:MAG: hypothetical protein ACRC8G_15795 [Plesiomonas shigelloides]
MAYFAEFDANKIVLRVVAIADNDLLDENGNEVEALGIAKCKELFGQETNWLQTSYNTYGGVHRNGGTSLRKNYAGINFSYDPQRDAFIPPKPEGDGYILDEDTCTWRNLALEQQAENTRIGVARV